MFEAVVNSLQAIEDASGATASPSIEIVVSRDAVLDGLEVAGDVNGFTITDNGVGFDDANPADDLWHLLYGTEGDSITAREHQRGHDRRLTQFG